ncbi:MAG: hypothetical protein HY819_04625 [Acidobacteria bacterium]|nr:hypothetical protein [Acidobacteriota bacterium]
MGDIKLARKTRVFIIWETNRALAEQLAVKLHNNGYLPLIGGSANPQDSDFYLSHQNINQLKQASKAIILFQDSTKKQNKEVNDVSYVFLQPNLTFELGFLLSRLPITYIKAFLINIKRLQLGTELHGIWYKEIISNSIEEISQDITTEFKSQLSQIVDYPLDIFINWHNLKKWLKEQIEEKSPFDSFRLATVLLHSIQPALYSSELAELSNLSKTIADKHRHNLSLQLFYTTQIINLVSQYYTATDKDQNKINTSEITAFKEQFINLSKEIKKKNDTTEGFINDDFVLWLNLIIHDFSGLCSLKIAQLSTSINDKKTELNFAKKTFRQSIEYLNQIKGTSQDAVWNLWKGYCNRNLGRTHSQLEQNKDAIRCFSEAIKAHDNAHRILDSMGVTETILIQITLEKTLIKLDEFKLTLKHNPNSELLTEVINTIQQNRPKTLIGIWQRLINQALEVAPENQKEMLKSW